MSQIQNAFLCIEIELWYIFQKELLAKINSGFVIYIAGKSLFLYISEMIPKLKTRQQKQGGGAESSAGGQDKGKKKKNKKRWRGGY